MPLKPVIPQTVLTAFLVPLLFGMTAPGRGPERQIEIVATDYAFILPQQLTPGPVVLHFNNIGRVKHELNISLLKKGVTVDQFMQELWADKPVAELREGAVGVLFAKQGAKSKAGLETNLKAGRDYVIICIFRDSAGAKRHHQLGMYSRLHITGGATPRNARSRVDTITADDYAFKYNATMRPGSHSFALVNNGRQRHEVAFGLLKAGVTVDSVYKTDKAGGNSGKLFEGDLGLLHTPGRTTALGRLKLDLLAGREYMIECSFQDSATAPVHSDLGMFGSIKVAAK